MNKTKIQYLQQLIIIALFFSGPSIPEVLEVGVGIKAIEEISQGVVAEDVLLL